MDISFESPVANLRKGIYSSYKVRVYYVSLNFAG